MNSRNAFTGGILAAILLLCTGPVRSEAPSPSDIVEVQEWFIASGGTVDLRLNESAMRELSLRLVARAGTKDNPAPPLSLDLDTSSAMHEIIVTNGQLASMIGGELTAGGTSFEFVGEIGSNVASDRLLIIHDPSGASAVEFKVYGGADPGLHLFNLSGVAVAFDDVASIFTAQGDVRIAGQLAERLANPVAAGANVGEITMTVRMQLSQTIVVSQNDVIESATMHPISPAGTEGVFPSPGPDVIVGDLPATAQYGRTGIIGSGTVGLSVGTTSCNKGDTPFNWFALPNTDHPMIPMNLYRLKSVGGAEHFEHIGQSWMKHGFTALQNNICGFGCTPTGGTHLGVGCSDPYSVGLNAGQCGLGSRAELHPYTGVTAGGANLGGSPCGSSNYPARDHTGHTHDGISHRVQVLDADLANPGARYFSEGHYLTPHEFNDPNAFANQNMHNNVSYREVSVTGPDIFGVFSFTNVAATVREAPAINAWTGATQVMVGPAPMVDGRAFVSYKVTNLGGGSWHYEYAVYNMNMDRSIHSISIPVHSSVTLSNIASHFPLNHAPEANTANYPNTTWVVNTTGGAIAWSTDDFAINPNANAIRFGTLYSFRFDADSGPQAANATIGLFKTATTTTAALQGPMPVGPPPVCGNSIVEAGEQCDDGNTIPGDGCDQNCQWETVCGNNILEFGEQCDDGNLINTDSCLDTCLNAACGDGFVWSGIEECDDGGQSATCDADCTFAACGDGTLNTLAGEQCDDGNTLPGDGCDAGCQNESNDLCADAIPIAEGATPFDTTGALTDGPIHGACEFDGQTYNDIWYDYTPSCTGNLTVSLCGSAYDTDLVIYNSCVCPMSDATLLACNDDNCPGGAPASYRSELPSATYPTIAVTSGNCYKIRVGGWNSGDSGTGTMTLTNSASPCIVDCNNNGVSDPKDISAGTSLDINADGVPDECQAAGNPIVGGRLYDKWWLELGHIPPTTDHPLWQFRPDQTSNTSTGSATWRCKECHGWDYKGATGVYGAGIHRTGIPGVLGTTLTEAQILTLLREPPNNGGGPGVLNGHDFGSVLTNPQINDITAFMLLGMIDKATFIDGAAAFIGNDVQGQIEYTTGGSIACTVCHGADGTSINFGTPQNPEWVGTVAVNNPWEFMHKGRYGHPASTMPSWIENGGANQGIADIGRYAQLNFPVDCTTPGPCDDGDPCTSNDTCTNGVCVGGPPPACTDTTCTDCNSNGIKDQCEGLQDCNADGIPDSCQAGDCNINGTNDICDITSAASQDCDGGPVGASTGGAAIFAVKCSFCHAADGSGAAGPDIRNYSRVQVWNKLLPPTTHSGGAHPEYLAQDFADIEAFLASVGSRGRPDLVPDECQTLADCDIDGTSDACELEAGTQVDADYNGIPDACQCTDPCSDGDACTTGDACSGGVCVPGGPTDCNDNNACTTDTCDSATGCANTPIACDDANACTADTCDTVTGCANAPISCDDGNACTTDTCDTVTGCANTPLDCNDNNACTTDSCDTVTGCANAPINCDDTNACTTDTCNPASGCVFTPVDPAVDCNDNNACTTDTCDTLTGCANTPIDPATDCDDANLCTTDDCDPVNGCVNTPVGCPPGNVCNPADGQCVACVTNSNCDDGDFCNGPEICDAALGCIAGTDPCNDGIDCTIDACNEITDTCVPVPIDSQCNNALFCDGTETCDVLLGCLPGTPVNCDDGNVCTSDACNETTDTCVNADITADCEDGDPCTDHTCDPLLGCITANNTAPCNDNSACTSNDTCANGACQGNTVDCSDGNDCTTDTCDPLTGCFSNCAPSGTACTVVAEPGTCDGACLCQPAGTTCPGGTGAECCDLDLNAIRDDVCTWCDCNAGTCSNINIAFGDLGGPFGDCTPDGFCNIHDAQAALVCFAGNSSCDTINIDAGGPFGDCAPDGFCNIHDSNHALLCFSGQTACSCGPSPIPALAPLVVDETSLFAVADRRTARPGETIDVRVFVTDPLNDLQSYQLDIAATGGRRGYLALVNVVIEERRDHVFHDAVDSFAAFNVGTGRMLSGLYGGDLPTPAKAYLATFVYAVSSDAAGTFVVDIPHDEFNQDQTFLISSFANKIAIKTTTPAVITVVRETSKNLR